MSLINCGRRLGALLGKTGCTIVLRVLQRERLRALADIP